MENEEFYKIVVATYESLQQRKDSRFRPLQPPPEDLEAKVKFYSNTDLFKSLVENLLPRYTESHPTNPEGKTQQDKDKLSVAKRNFQENPLSYFKEHYPDGSITRAELAVKDQGLYRALFRHKQMDEAIPERATQGSELNFVKEDSHLKIITEAYAIYNGNASKAHKHLPYSVYTFLKYWKNAGLKIRKRGRQKKERLSTLTRLYVSTELDQQPTQNL